MRIVKRFRYIHKKDIETVATNILRAMEQIPNYAPKWPLEASRVAEFLGLDVVWDDIPDDGLGAIAARILPLERLIEINENIPKLRGGFGESTIGHEIGHWVLHINHKEVERCWHLEKKGVKIQVEPLLCRNEIQAKGREWQAQYFASCLLMPHYVLEEVKKGKDLTKWRHLYAMAGELGVTISNLVHRLKDLGWIYLDNSRKIVLGEVVLHPHSAPQI